MKKITTSIETCLRYFENKIKRNDFLTFQVRLVKPVPINKALFEVIVLENKKQYTILSQEFQIAKNHITFFNSHEDPIVQDNEYIFLSLHIPRELLPQKFEMISVKVIGLNELDFIHNFSEISSEIFCSQLHSSLNIDNKTICSNEDTQLTFHLGNRNGEYSEEYFTLRKNDLFSFSDYIFKYAYIGIQCSYENQSPEIEEKHIIKGQKGIYETGLLKDKNGNIIAQGLLPFNHKFLNNFTIENTKNNDFLEVSSISELLEYHKKNPVCFFESSLIFLEDEYKQKNTYSQAKIYSKGKQKTGSHLSLDVCSSCKYNCECIQIVPSGLSGELMRKNLMLGNSSDCPIYQLINKKKA